MVEKLCGIFMYLFPTTHSISRGLEEDSQCSQCGALVTVLEGEKQILFLNKYVFLLTT